MGWMADWRSIDEDGDRVVVLRGVPVVAPRAWRRRGALVTAAGLAHALRAVLSWTAAAAAHLLVAALLWAVVSEIARPPEDSILTASIWKGTAGEEGKKVEPVVVPEPPPAPVPEPPKPEPPKPAPAPAPPEPEFLPAAPVVKAEPAPAAPVVGAGASAPAPKPAAPSTSPRPAVDPDRDPTGALKSRRAGDLDKLRSGTPREIVVVTGQYDGVEEVLDRLGVPHTKLEPEQLAKADLSKTRALLVNCHTAYQSGLFRLAETKDVKKEVQALAELEQALEDRIKITKDRKKAFEYGLELLKVTSRLSTLRQQMEIVSGAGELVATIRNFVEGGGYLFTSDWGMTLVEKAVPGYVKSGGNAGPLVTPIRVKPGMEKHRLLEEAFPTEGKRVLWDVDSGSYSIKIEKPAFVETLVEGASMGRHAAVAVTFPVERKTGRPGRVLHVLSHFRKQASTSGDYALQNLLLNFLLERLAP